MILNCYSILILISIRYSIDFLLNFLVNKKYIHVFKIHSIQGSIQLNNCFAFKYIYCFRDFIYLPIYLSIYLSIYLYIYTYCTKWKQMGAVKAFMTGNTLINLVLFLLMSHICKWFIFEVQAYVNAKYGVLFINGSHWLNIIYTKYYILYTKYYI